MEVDKKALFPPVGPDHCQQLHPFIFMRWEENLTQRSNAPSETMADSSSHICAHFKHSDCNHINYTTFAKVSKVGQIVTNSYDTSLQNSRYVLEEWQNLAILIRLWILSISYAPEWALERHNTQSLRTRWDGMRLQIMRSRTFMDTKKLFTRFYFIYWVSLFYLISTSLSLIIATALCACGWATPQLQFIW